MDNVRMQAFGSEIKILKVDYTLNEVEKIKTKYFSKVYLKQDIEYDFEEIKKDFKSRIKDCNAEINVMTGNLRRGYKEVRHELFLIPNYTDGTMEYFTEAGELIESETRKLMPQEMQLKFDLTGTNN